MIELYVDGMAENFDWIKSLGAEDPQYFNYCEFPELEGSSSFTPFTVAGNTGMSATAFGGDGAAYHLLKDNVNKRDNITVWYEAEASRLIQDGETKIVHGVTVKIDGREVNVRAKNAVVLACGGFENNKEMQQDFTDRYFWPSTGNAHYNTGDGIRMASDVGADLWHMGQRREQHRVLRRGKRVCDVRFPGDRPRHHGRSGWQALRGGGRAAPSRQVQRRRHVAEQPAAGIHVFYL